MVTIVAILSTAEIYPPRIFFIGFAGCQVLRPCEDGVGRDNSGLGEGRGAGRIRRRGKRPVGRNPVRRPSMVLRTCGYDDKKKRRLEASGTGQSRPDLLRAEFSHRIKEEFANGHEYYSQHGKSIELPKEATSRPSSEFLSWHNENVYLD
jgi:hypothetical protein